MESSKIFENLKNPQLYGPKVESVDVLQTHISFVALTGAYAYKVKKPVNFGFLDFSTLEKRKYFCEEEMRLNRRLCPDIYLDVLPITRKNNNLELNGDGKVVDYALKMKEFPQESIMTNLLKQGKVNEETIEKIIDILVDFYKSGERSNEIDNYGTIESVKRNIDENFEQTESFVDTTILKDVYNYIKNVADSFFNKKKDVFEKRIIEGRIRDCHGDLHSGNIVVSDKIYIFDCIEFNKRFRYSDVASDIGFLAMDLDYLNFPHLSSYLIDKYVEKSNDKGIFDILNFYKSYRAYVRGKVIGFQLNDPNIDEAKKKEIIEITKKYFDLSHYYASLVSIDLDINRPIIFIVSGLTGTGKSTIALKTAIDYHAHLINTDIVRKEIAGIDKFERHHDEPDTGLYSPEKIDFTYEKVVELAATFLEKKGNVVLDATFQKEKYREMAEKTAKEHNAILIKIQCVCPENVVKARLKERIKKKSVSDGRWEIYLHQKETFEPYYSESNYIVMDTSDESYDYRMNFFRRLVAMINEA